MTQTIGTATDCAAFLSSRSGTATIVSTALLLDGHSSGVNLGHVQQYDRGEIQQLLCNEQIISWFCLDHCRGFIVLDDFIPMSESFDIALQIDQTIKNDASDDSQVRVSSVLYDRIHSVLHAGSESRKAYGRAGVTATAPIANAASGSYCPIRSSVEDVPLHRDITAGAKQHVQSLVAVLYVAGEGDFVLYDDW